MGTVDFHLKLAYMAWLFYHKSHQSSQFMRTSHLIVTQVTVACFTPETSQVIVVDEIGSKEEVATVRTIAERGHVPGSSDRQPQEDQDRAQGASSL